MVQYTTEVYSAYTTLLVSSETLLIIVIQGLAVMETLRGYVFPRTSKEKERKHRNSHIRS